MPGGVEVLERETRARASETEKRAEASHALARETSHASARETSARLRVVVRGAVQGVGFRPFVYRLATSLALRGWVNNSAQGVFVEVEGREEELKEFLLRLERERPPRASVQSLESSFLDAAGYQGFEIRPSEQGGEKTALVLPDSATCPDCLREIFDPANRRYLYPFTNCTNCGPRFSIIEALPYDRPNTTMSGFEMCEDCRAEYENPLDRRFHAQPNACPACGPHLKLWDARGDFISVRHDALAGATEALRRGHVLALKGVGGFQLIVDARNDEAVRTLRARKHREEKPFALMFPSLDALKADCEVSELEERLLLSPESPIVLLRRKNAEGEHAISNFKSEISDQKSQIKNQKSEIAPSVAPGNPYLGAMLPYTPLHHLLMRALGFAVVATSGNLSDEPICTDDIEAFERLGPLADYFLVHDRPIARHVDDSIVRVMAGRETLLRRARGYAPLPVHLEQATAPLVAVGAHMKNAVATAVGGEVFISQHVGDLDTRRSFEAFSRVVSDFRKLYEVEPRALACDSHPDYRSTRFAHDSGLPVVQVQHHYAHVLACMAENELDAPALGVAWDGAGHGADGTTWGGEFLLVGDESFERAAHLRTFRLPGGDRAAREPRRAAAGLLYEIFGDALFRMKALAPVAAFGARELKLLGAALKRGINAPVTSSMGRLFDAVASIAGLRQESRFEGQAASELEFALEGVETDAAYEIDLLSPCVRASSHPRLVDWEPLVVGALADLSEGAPPSLISAKFHNALAEAVVAVARHVGCERVVLTGGCFQNRYLTERAVARLREEGFRPYWHQRVPPNDGGIALGQVAAALRELRKV
jgi:hydrogenase maturation protein HypF